MLTQPPISGYPVIRTTTGQVRIGEGTLLGFFVNASTALTVQLYDNTSAAAPLLLDTFTVPAVGWYNFPVNFNTGLWAVLGGAGSVSFVIM